MNEKELIQILKSERCPDRVRQHAESLPRERRSMQPSGAWFAISSVMAVFVLMMSLLFIDFDAVLQNGGHSDADTEIVQTRTNDATAELPHDLQSTSPGQAAEELKLVLAYIGMTLREETERTGEIIVSRGLPVITESVRETRRVIKENL